MNRLLLAAVALGVCCRVRQYAANTSLWHDESFVALNILHVRLDRLLGPGDWNEPSPPGFLLAEQLLTAIIGPSEYGLRALPLLAAVVALLMFAALARRACADVRGASWAVVLLALSAKLIADANLVKHFSLDLLIAVTVTALAWRAYRTPTPGMPVLLVWGAIGAAALWFSYAAAFVCAGTSIVLAAPAATRWPRPARHAYAIANGLVLLSAALLWVPISAQRSDVVVGFWTRAFPPLDGVLPLVVWLGRALLALFDYFWQPLGGVLLLLALLAAPTWWRTERRPLLLLLWLPVGIALGAALVRWWPFGGNQHMVFAAPAVLLLAGDGIELARRRLAAHSPALAWAALAALLAPGVLPGVYHLGVARERHEMRPVIAFMQSRWTAGDQLAVFDPATFQFYTGRDVRDAPAEYTSSERVWVITPRSSGGALHADVQRVVDGLSADRPRLAALEVHGAAAYLFGAATEGIPHGGTETRRGAELGS